MPSETTRQRLLRELSDYRWIILQQLADEAEEAGIPLMARGWRWLCGNRRWPSNRLGNKYGWMFVELVHYGPGCQNLLSGRILTHSHKLPTVIRQYNEDLVTTADADLGRLMSRAARAVGGWLIALEKEAALLAKAQADKETA